MPLQNEIILYQPDTTLRLDVVVDNETVWLTQAQMVMLFERDQSVLSRHINNVFKENELDAKSNMQILHIANSDKPVAFYSLDVIISVGYRVKSQRGTDFRRWANSVLKEYILRGDIAARRMERLQRELFELRLYVEKTFIGYDHKNNELTAQFEHINQTLTELQTTQRQLEKPHFRVGYEASRERRMKELSVNENK